MSTAVFEHCFSCVCVHPALCVHTLLSVHLHAVCTQCCVALLSSETKIELVSRRITLTAKKYLENVNRQLEKLQAELTQLKDKYDIAMMEKQQIQEETDIMERRLEAADKLIHGLSSENVRWSHELDDLKAQRVRLLPRGYCLIHVRRSPRVRELAVPPGSTGASSSTKPLARPPHAGERHPRSQPFLARAPPDERGGDEQVVCVGWIAPGWAVHSEWDTDHSVQSHFPLCIEPWAAGLEVDQDEGRKVKLEDHIIQRRWLLAASWVGDQVRISLSVSER